MSVTAQSLEKLKVEICTGSHTFVADEPVEAGGENAGPNPYELLLGALAACKIMTVELDARQKGWPLTKVDVELDTHKEYGKDCHECTSEDNVKVDIIECTISFQGGLTPEQKERLKSISERCPVHRTLVNEIVIRTTMR